MIQRDEAPGAPARLDWFTLSEDLEAVLVAANPTELGRITSEQVLEKRLATASPGVAAFFIACSQLPTRTVLPVLAERLARPAWSSVKAAAWQASRMLAAKTARAA